MAEGQDKPAEVGWVAYRLADRTLVVVPLGPIARAGLPVPGPVEKPDGRVVDVFPYVPDAAPPAAVLQYDPEHFLDYCQVMLADPQLRPQATPKAGLDPRLYARLLDAAGQRAPAEAYAKLFDLLQALGEPVLLPDRPKAILQLVAKARGQLP